jgi:hypothetical protein
MVLLLAGCCMHPEQVQINGLDGVYALDFGKQTQTVIELEWGQYIAEDWSGCGCYDLSDDPSPLDERFGTASFVSERCPRLLNK